MSIIFRTIKANSSILKRVNEITRECATNMIDNVAGILTVAGNSGGVLRVLLRQVNSFILFSFFE